MRQYRGFMQIKTNGETAGISRALHLVAQRAAGEPI